MVGTSKSKEGWTQVGWPTIKVWGCCKGGFEEPVSAELWKIGGVG